jgi:hypothetical protein
MFNRKYRRHDPLSTSLITARPILPAKMRSGVSCMSPRTQAPDLEEKRHFLPLPSLHMILVERQVEGVPVQAELLVESTLQFRGNVVFSIMGLEQALDQKTEFTCCSSPHDVQRVKEGLVEL